MLKISVVLTLLITFMVGCVSGQAVHYQQNNPLRATPTQSRTSSAQQVIPNGINNPETETQVQFDAGIATFKKLGLSASGCFLGGLIGGTIGYGIGYAIEPESSSGLGGFSYPSDAQAIGCLLGIGIGSITGIILGLSASTPKPLPKTFLGKSPEYVEKYLEVHRR